jgi:hypothetical protein
MGTMVCANETPSHSHTLSLTTLTRIINAEIRQPKSEQGASPI